MAWQALGKILALMVSTCQMQCADLVLGRCLGGAQRLRGSCICSGIDALHEAAQTLNLQLQVLILLHELPAWGHLMLVEARRDCVRSIHPSSIYNLRDG